MTRYRCDRCGSEDIRQEISFMVNSNTYKGEILDMESANWEDYFYCNDCVDECPIAEVDEPSDHDMDAFDPSNDPAYGGPDDCNHSSFHDDCDHCEYLRGQ